MGEQLKWQSVGGPVSVDMFRARVNGGWLYASRRESPAPHVAALAFVPDARSADLSKEDVEALRKARDIVRGSGRDVDRHVRVVIDRLLAAAEGDQP